MKISAELLGLIMLALVEVPQTMSAWLPSPATAAVSAGDETKRRWLRIGQWAGAAMSLAFAGAITFLAYTTIGWHAAWIFVGAAIVLGIFLWVWRKAMKEGEDNNNKEPGLGT